MKGLSRARVPALSSLISREFCRSSLGGISSSNGTSDAFLSRVRMEACFRCANQLPYEQRVFVGGRSREIGSSAVFVGDSLHVCRI